jgi:hypothetical protein
VGPAKEAARGAIITDWEAYTPTLTNLTASTNTLEWKRVGDSIFIRGRIVVTAVTGEIRIGFPDGVVSDNSTTDRSNFIRILDAGTVFYTGVATSTGVNYFTISNEAGGGNFGVGNPMTWASGDEIQISPIQFKVQGWSSNVVLSSESSGREIAFIGYVSTDFSVPTATWTSVPNASMGILKDSTDMWNGVDSIVIPETGDYLVEMILGLTNNASGERYAAIAVNGTQYIIAEDSYPTTARLSRANGSRTIPLVKGDVIKFQVYQDSGSTLTWFASGTNSYLTIRKLSSSSQTIAASEKVYVRASKDDGQVFANGTADVITFNKTQINSHGSSVWNGSTFTAPRSGYLKVNASILWNGSTLWVKPASHSILVYKNGTVFSYLQYKSIQIDTAGTLIYADNSGYDLIPVNQGDVVDLRGLQGSGGNNAIISTEVYNHVIFEMD